VGFGLQQLRRAWRKVGPIRLGDLRLLEPESRYFGLENGTPVDRRFIDTFLASRAGHFNGVGLEVGETRYLQRFGRATLARMEVLHVRADATSGVTLVGDLAAPADLPEAIADCFVCTQTFNFIYDVRAAVEGAYKLLKPGGVLLATVAGASQMSRFDASRWGDFWRFTSMSAERLFSERFKGNVEVTSYGNLPAAMAFMQGVCVEDFPDPLILDKHDPDYPVVIGIMARKEAVS
jgi:SAM-dependent methyltransferase